MKQKSVREKIWEIYVEGLTVGQQGGLGRTVSIELKMNSLIADLKQLIPSEPDLKKTIKEWSDKYSDPYEEILYEEQIAMIAKAISTEMNKRFEEALDA